MVPEVIVLNDKFMVICDKEQYCMDFHCLHKYAHRKMFFGKCNDRHCDILDCNVTCKTTKNISNILPHEYNIKSILV